MEVTFSVNLDLSKSRKDEKSKSSLTKNCNCGCDESNLEKCLDVAQKFIKMIKVK